MRLRSLEVKAAEDDLFEPELLEEDVDFRAAFGVRTIGLLGVILLLTG